MQYEYAMRRLFGDLSSEPANIKVLVFDLQVLKLCSVFEDNWVSQNGVLRYTTSNECEYYNDLSIQLWINCLLF